MHQPVLPELLESIHKSDYFPWQRHRWNTNEEIAAILISFDKHEHWLSKEVKIRPKSGSMMLYSRKKVRYRRDGYCWKKRKDGKTTREDHMKLKVQGHECIYGCYVHSAILPTFHRRCYWLLQNPDIVLVHYLNVPYSDDNKIVVPALNYFADNKKEWTKEELISELKPMFFSENEPDLNNELEISTVETIEAIVQQLMVKQRAKVKALEEAQDGGQALTFVTAITNSQKEANKNNLNNNHIKNKQVKNTKTFSGLKDLNNSLTTGPTITQQQQQVNQQDNLVKITDAKTNQIKATTTTTVQLVQLASNQKDASQTGPNQAPTSTQAPAPATASVPAPSSLFLNLSQFHSGSGLLILNNPSQTLTGQQSITGPVTLVYGKPTTANGQPNGQKTTLGTPTIPAVVCTNNSQLRTLLKNANLNLTTQKPVQTNSSISLPITVSKSLPNQNGNFINVNTVNVSNSTNSNVINKSNEINDNNNDEVSHGQVQIKMEISSGNDHNEQLNHGKQEKDNASFHEKDNNHNEDEDEHEEKSKINKIEHKEEAMIISSPSSSPDPLISPSEKLLQDNLLAETKVHMSSVGLGSNAGHGLNATHNYFNHDLIDPIDLNPMDFIDNDIPTPDDTLLNLDAFDMLNDIGNLDDLTNPNLSPLRTILGNTNTNINTNINTNVINNNANHQINDNNYHQREPAAITDFCPEWCYPEGGIKLLIAGPWYSPQVNYSIIFDGISVSGQLVQTGVLRCYVPAHEPGFVSMLVACNGVVMSNPVIFEYRRSNHQMDQVPNQKNFKENLFHCEDNIFKFALMERFQMLESKLSKNLKRISITGIDNYIMKHHHYQLANNFEDCLVQMCAQMMQLNWMIQDPTDYQHGIAGQMLRSGLSHSDMSMIHLAAALNYSKLINSLIKWRMDNPCLIIDYETDPFALDQNGSTPLLWACARGHRDSAVLLYHLNRSTVHIKNHFGDSPIELAQKYGYCDLAGELQQLIECPETETRNVSNGMFNSRKSSLDNTSSASSLSSSPSSSTLSVRKGLSTVKRGFNATSTNCRLVKCFSADSTYSSSNLFNQQNDPSLMETNLFTNICDSEEDLGLASSSHSHRGSIVSDIISDPVSCVGSGSIHDDDHHESSRVLTLAEQIIAAMPDRIKAASSSLDSDEDFVDGEDDEVEDSNDNSINCDYGGSDGIISIQTINTNANDNQIQYQEMINQNDVFNYYDLNTSNDNYHYRDATATPTTSSPASSSCLHSPGSFHLESPSPPPTTADFCEFFQASHHSGQSKAQFLTKELGDLTLTDKEQRELYEASRVIQKAYRSYKGRKRQEEQDKEKEKAAAILIQSYYRRYKQYMYYRQMNRAALVIQSQYRSYCENKRFKKAVKDVGDVHGLVHGIGHGNAGGNYSIVDCNNTTVNLMNFHHRNSLTSNSLTQPSNGLKRTYSQRRQHQAARKIQQFMRQSKNKLQKERALLAAGSKETYNHVHAQVGPNCIMDPTVSRELNTSMEQPSQLPLQSQPTIHNVINQLTSHHPCQ